MSGQPSIQVFDEPRRVFGLNRHERAECAENRSRAHSRVRRWIDVCVVLVWGGLLSVSLFALAAYSMDSGEIEVPEKERVLALPHAFDRETLIMAIHPKCPCSAASVYELERLVTRNGRGFDVLVLAYEPVGRSGGWSRTLTREIESKIPGATILVDPGAEMAYTLGMRTSGSVVLVRADGTPLFWGGITASRGHAGDNLGSDAVTAILKGEIKNAAPTLVYGCGLRSEAECGEMCGEEAGDGR